MERKGYGKKKFLWLLFVMMVIFIARFREPVFPRSVGWGKGFRKLRKAKLGGHDYDVF